VTDLALIADDLTGAADSGVPFAVAGFTTAIPFDRARREATDVLCLSTDSRDVPVSDAERRVRQALVAAFGKDGAHRPAWIYKKMDSALRGHPAEELLVTMRLARITRCVVAPAIPSQGRTTVGGYALDHGIRLAETPIGREHGRDNLARMFQRSVRVPVRLIDLPTVRGSTRGLRNALTLPGSWIAIADAETDDDLSRVAEVGIASGIRLFCGAAGLTGVLARRLPIHQVNRLPALKRADRPVLVVAGSRHAVTETQIDVAIEAGAGLVRLDQCALDDDAPVLDGYQRRILASLASGRATIVTTVGLAPSRLDGNQVAERLAEVAICPEILTQIGGLVLTGGDVAAAVCRALGVRTIWLRGDVLPAIPWASISGDQMEGLPIVTKAGSFGPPEAIQSAVEFLSRLPANR
jgi:D-threonate/D-erythronate kinase